MATAINELNNKDIKEQGEKENIFSLRHLLQDAAKRIFDILLASIGLIILAPFFTLFAILIRRDTPGPAFFWCARMGKNSRPFRMLKFRTMYNDPCRDNGLPVTCEEDERITPFGRWLRDTKINELPQLWNVLIGEMSMVGPRPEDVGIAETWPENLREEILSVKPGLTSPASILYHDEEHLLSRANVMGEYVKNIMPDKMRLDSLYVRNRSLSSDIDLIVWTLIIVVPRLAKNKIPEGYLFAGPFFRLMHRYVSWFFMDVIIAMAAVGVMGVFWRLQEPLNWGIDRLAILAILIAFLFSGFNSIAGLNRILWERATVEDAFSLAFSSGIVTLLLILADFLDHYVHWLSMPSLPVVMICAIGLTAQIGFLTARFRWRIVTSLASRWIAWRKDASGFGEKVLIVGAGEGSQVANWLLRRGEFQHIFSIVGLVDDNIPTIQGMRLDGSLVLGRTTDIPELVKKHDIGVIFFTSNQITAETKEFVFHLCQTSNLRVAYIDNLVEAVTQQLTRPITSLEQSLWSADHNLFFALHDCVTGLPNRYLFQDQLVRSLAYARRYKTNPIVLFIDLEKMKQEWEVLGEKASDTLIKEFSKRLLKFKRESDTLARLDELKFALILENVDNETTMLVVAKRISKLLSEPLDLDGVRYRLCFNLSVCTNLEKYPPDELVDIRRIYNQGKDVLVFQDDRHSLAYP
jgi:diguanylate cyclase (GGDEF)-like protein